MCFSKPKSFPQKDGLKLLSFNIEGLETGMEDPCLIDLLYEHDICLLQETWKRDETKINLPGCWDFSQVRPKYRKKGRHSGGVSILCKDEYRPGIKILESSEGFIWMKLDAKFFNLMNDLFLCAAYFPPQYSQNHYSKKVDYYQCLNDAIIKYGNRGNVMIAGDLNSRVGTNSEESGHEIPNIDDLCPDEVRAAASIRQRLSCDQKVNGYGKKLLQLCQAFNLKLTNGSVPGDRQGSYTCYGGKGSSVVDYFICDSSLFNIVSRMNVHPPKFGSIHSPISVHLDTKFQVQTSDKNSSTST
jgi:exonuclease III